MCPNINFCICTKQKFRRPEGMSGVQSKNNVSLPWVNMQAVLRWWSNLYLFSNNSSFESFDFTSLHAVSIRSTHEHIKGQRYLPILPVHHNGIILLIAIRKWLHRQYARVPRSAANLRSRFCQFLWARPVICVYDNVESFERRTHTNFRRINSELCRFTNKVGVRVRKWGSVQRGCCIGERIKSCLCRLGKY